MVKPFAGSNLYTATDMPDIDLLVITHDHWDHLDCRTVKALRKRVNKVVCGLGVGAHLERWGYRTDQIVEMDWNETAEVEGLPMVCLPARHFSGRSLRSNQTLWASFLIDAPSRRVYIGGDGGYDGRFARIEREYPNIDLAVMENGQYNADWRYIHLMPEFMTRAAKELGARRILTVHHGKYALSPTRWDEPLHNIEKMRADSLNVLAPEIGEVIDL